MPIGPQLWGIKVLCPIQTNMKAYKKMTAHKNYIQSLNFRIDTISDALKILINSSQEKKKEATVSYRTEIAFFIHFVKNSYLSKSLFEELLNYNSILDSSIEYISIIREATNRYKQIAQLIETHPDFEKFTAECDDDWSNPFGGSSTIKASLLLKKLANLSEFTPSKNIDNFNHIYNILVSICERWQNHIRETDLTEIVKSFDNCRKELFRLEYLTGFQKEYVGANCAIRLNHLFNAVIPLHHPKSSGEGIFEGLIVSGTDIEKDELYFNDCKKIKNYIIQKFDEGFSIEATVRSFITYMECYRKASDFPKGEKQLQKEFELYLFDKGYFPLSEVQLKNARIDTLSVNDSNAFLIEYKQIGWSKKEISLKRELDKLRSSFIQSEIYSKRLSVYPSIKKEIYIIIFSKRYFIFKNGNNILKYNGLTFIFHMVYLGDENPSKIKNTEIFDIETIINE